MAPIADIAWAESWSLFWRHTPLAAASAAVFFIGFASAWVVVRSDIRFLIWFPLWFLKTITSVVRRRPSFPFIFMVIFGFNSVAMFVYMLTGMAPFLPAAICFLTGMNIAIAVLKGHTLSLGARGCAPPENPPEDSAEKPGEDGAGQGDSPPGEVSLGSGCFILACFVVVLALELPCFWFSIALGTSMEFGEMGRFTSAGMMQVMLPRVLAYLRIIMPLLAVSAAAEATAIRRSRQLATR